MGLSQIGEMQRTLLHVVGARPNFMKVAPLYQEVAGRSGVRQVLVHTGQHYDNEMSGVFFEEFGLPAPDHNLAVGSGTHAAQTAAVMVGIEPILERERPDRVVVVGDVNSTLAATLVAVKLGIPTAHVEAGLRSFDRTMPEEINRVLTDSVADLLLTPSRDADENLLREGVEPHRIRFVGNVMIDTLVRMLPRARERAPAVRAAHSLPDRYLLATLHRPGNVDDVSALAEIVAGLEATAAGTGMPIAFPVHPRTRRRMAEDGYRVDDGGPLRLLEPLGYIDFLALTASAAAVITDSGGIQEETTYLGIPCLTVRPNTERPVTITEGTNRLVPADRRAILEATTDALSAPRRPGRPELWDGRTSERIADALLEG